MQTIIIRYLRYHKLQNGHREEGRVDVTQAISAAESLSKGPSLVFDSLWDTASGHLALG